MSTSRFSMVRKMDDAGNPTEDIVNAADGTPVRRVAYSYDKAGKLFSVAQYGATGSISQKWIYDGDGIVKKRNGFDNAGSLVRQESYSYEYDTVGNWVKRVTTSRTPGLQNKEAAGDQVEVTYRTIKYYPPAGDFQVNGGVIPGGLPKNPDSQPSILGGKVLTRLEPVYPNAARAARIAGSVVVELTVDEEGDVLSARAVSGHPLLRETSLDAAWDWKFSPTIYQGRPIKVIGAIEFKFNP